jgi:hypothetical protein
MNKLFAVFVALVALVVFGAQVARSQILADALFLKSGEKVEGRIIAESDLSVTISTDTSTGKAERMIPRSEISNITRSEPLAPTQTPNADSPESPPDRSSVSPDKKWECQRPDEDDLGPKIVKAGTNEVALDLSDECRGSVDWSPDSKRFALTCRERGRSNGGTSLYQLRGAEWKPLKSPNDDVQEILNKAIAAQVKKSGLPKKTDLRLIWETLEVRRWVDSNTAILYGGLHEVVRENSETRFDVDFVFTLKFDDAGNWKIIKTHRMSDKEVEERGG